MAQARTYKPYFIIVGVIFIALVVLIAALTLMKPRPGIAFEGEPLEIKIQPTGDLQTIPNEIVFHFSRPFAGLEGIVISEDSLSNFITIKPSVPAYGKWLTESTFEIFFTSPPAPDKKYEVKLFRIPLISGAQEIPAQTYTFTTPPFELMNVSFQSLEMKKAVMALDFNYPPVMSELMQYIKIYDAQGNDVVMHDARTEKDKPEMVLITVPVEKAPVQYKFVLKKGLVSTLGVALKKDFAYTVPIGFTTGPITVRDRRIEESEDGYMLMFQITSSAERKLTIKEDNLEKFVRIKPELSFRVTAAEDYIYVFGDFIPEKTYEVTLKSGIMTKRGSILHDDFITEFTIPREKEALQFVYRGRYFGKTGDWNLPLKIAQICSVKVTITYMPPENVLFWHARDYAWKGSINDYGEVVLKEQRIPLEQGTKEQMLWLNLRNYLPEVAHGMYLIEAAGYTENKNYIHDQVAVVISDISLVVKWYETDIYVWALNSATLKPENGVALEVRSSKNFLTGTGTTDINGFCHITALKQGRDPYIVFATHGDEWTYAHTQSLMLPREAYDVAGETPSVPYLAYVYLERDLYRPGEDVHCGVVVREKYSFKGIALPLRVAIRDPQGRNYLSLSLHTDAVGLCEFTFPTAASAPTGKYMLELIAGDRTLATGHVFVETFVPERMRVNATLPDTFDIYKPFALAIEAEYLFGASASGEHYTARVIAEESKFTCSGYTNYAFGIYRFGNEEPPSWRSEELKGTLDQTGRATQVIRVDTTVVLQGPVQLACNITVTEGGSGRVTAKTVRRMLYTRPFYVGLKSSASRVTSNIPITIKGVLLKPDCSFYAGSAKLFYKLYRLTYAYSYAYYDDYSWDSRVQKIPVTEAKAVSASDGEFSFSFTPKSMRDDYLVEVYDETHGTVSQLRLPGWGWWYGDEERVESPEVVPLRLSKQEYDASEQVTVEALLPFEGRVLWTVELDTLYESAWADALGEVATWSFRAPRGVSTVYVSALLVRSSGNYLVQRGFGIQRVPIRPGVLKLGFNITVPERIRPGDELMVAIKGTEKFKGTIAVVDEGILQITEFKTPDPYAGILRDMRLAMNSAESFGWIMKKFLEKIGGGFAEREKAFPEARFARLVSFWSGILESKGDGGLVYKVKVPEYNGKLRVMVLGVNEKRFGAEEADVVVKSDVIVSPTIPRFMCTTDNFSFPITFINTTEKAQKASVTITMKGGTIKGSSKFGIQLKPQEKKIQWLDCSAGEEPGSLELTIDATAEQEKYHEAFVIPLYPNVPYITESEYITIGSRQTMDLKRYFDDWYPRAHTANLMLSSIPGLARLNHVRYAIHYPYGCIEQTSTSTLVLLRLSRLLAVIAPAITREKYNEMVNHGLRRILSMQTVSGGFTFWPGGYGDEPWITSYATFVLLEAKSAGFMVPESAIKAALNYLDALLEKGGFEYYVLARGNALQKKPELIDRLITLGRKEQYDAANALWVAGAIYESGRTTEAERLLDIALEKEPPTTRRYRDDFYSPLQLLGMRLYMVQNINPQHAQVRALLLDLTKTLGAQPSYYYSTQELAWSMLGLGLYADKSGAQEVNATLKIDGKVVQAHKEPGVSSWTLKNAAQQRSIVLENQAAGEFFLNIENTGFSKKQRAFERFSSGINLWRTVFDYYGQKISSAAQGDLVVLKIAVFGNAYYDNVAVEASIPAGLEIENPRLGRNDMPVWIKETEKVWNPDYVDIKDDRIIIFGAVYDDTLSYYMLARAVTPGAFLLPPARGIVMYNPELNAHTEAGRFEVYKK